MGRAGQMRILQLAEIEREIDLLENIVSVVVTGTSASPLLSERYEYLRQFFGTFKARELATSEAGQPWHSRERIAATVYGKYRCAKSGLRSRLERFRRAAVRHQS